MWVLIGLISGTKSMTAYPAPARELYSPSALFRGALRHLTGRADVIYVLSAKYGLLPLDQVAAPYDQTLKDATQDERTAWARQVAADLVARHGPSLRGITFEFHTGAAYRHPLEALLQAAAATCTCPVDGLSIGERLGYYAASGATAQQATPVPAPVTQTAPSPVPVAAGRQRFAVPAADPTFAAFLSGLRGRRLRTGTGAAFQVADVEVHRVIVVPESTRQQRPIRTVELTAAYTLLRQTCSITLADIREHASEANPAYVFAILAALPEAHVIPGRPIRLEWRP